MTVLDEAALNHRADPRHESHPMEHHHGANHPVERDLVETAALAGHLPAALLTGARDALCARALACGITLVSCNDWPALEAINRANLTSWLPIMHRPNGTDWFWIGAADADGRIVGTQAGVLLDCTGRSLGERLSDLSFFYRDPATERTPGEHCFCASDAAFDSFGKFCYLTAGWTHPDRRGQGLFHLVGRAVRLLAAGRWAPHWWGGLVAPETAAQWTAEKAGPLQLERRPTILYRNPAAGYEYPPLRFMRISRSGFFLDMRNAVHSWTQDRMTRPPAPSRHPISEWV